jgi:hypothetical protein
MIIHKATKITFEALGKEHVVYTDHQDHDYIQEQVHQICPTAFVNNICTDVISKEEFLSNNLENLVQWNLKLKR